MDMISFIKSLEGAFEGLSPGSLTAGTEFRKLEQWDSISALNILAVLDSEYDVQLNRAEITGCNTVQDIFELVKKKKAS